jgi:hypothetical protein
MAWSRGHKNDWDYFASETGDPAWSYESVLNIYRRIETGMAHRTQSRRASKSRHIGDALVNLPRRKAELAIYPATFPI